MDRKWEAGAAVSPPTLDNASDGYATNGNPGTGTPATTPGAHMFHMMVEEPLSVITAAGITPDKTSVVQLLAALNLLYDSQGIEPGGRLTLSAGVPVTTTDVSAATTVRYTPFVHNRIKLYDGTRWKWYTFSEISQNLSDTTKSPAATAASKNYDMFVWDDGGTVLCTRGPLWDGGGGSNTARGTGADSTELEFFGGRWVNKIAISNGPAARRGLYVGTIGTSAANQVNDTLTTRHVWNLYNRMHRPMRRLEATNGWSQTAGTSFRQANSSTANQLDVITGMNDEPVECNVSACSQYAGVVSGFAVVGIGLDSTTAFAPGCLPSVDGTLTAVSHHSVHFHDFVGLGRHSLVWIEKSESQDGLWFGDIVNTTVIQSGMIGSIRA